MDEQGKYSIERAQHEAEDIQHEVESGRAENYPEAEKNVDEVLLEAQKAFEINHKARISILRRYLKDKDFREIAEYLSEIHDPEINKLVEEENVPFYSFFLYTDFGMEMVPKEAEDAFWEVEMNMDGDNTLVDIQRPHGATIFHIKDEIASLRTLYLLIKNLTDADALEIIKNIFVQSTFESLADGYEIPEPWRFFLKSELKKKLDESSFSKAMEEFLLSPEFKRMVTKSNIDEGTHPKIAEKRAEGLQEEVSDKMEKSKEMVKVKWQAQLNHIARVFPDLNILVEKILEINPIKQ